MYQNIIVIPYRKREKHLDYFIKHTVPFIEELMPETKVVVVEQCEGKLFNRGKVLNVGFKEYMDKTYYFITHDVDINPTKLCIKKYYKQNINENTVLGIYTSCCNTLGGIIKIKSTSINKINGFPNNIWGWGTEDKALQNRSEFFNIIKKTNLTNKKKHPEFFKIFNNVNDRFKDSEKKYKAQAQEAYVLFNKYTPTVKKKIIMSSGINTLEYKITERKNLHKIVELIKVEI